MVSLQTFLIGLLLISTLTGLTTQAVKSIYTESGKNYRANTISGIVALFLSAAIGVGYILVTNTDFTAQTTVCLVALSFMSWLCAMVGYDKVVQSISQFKTIEGAGKNE